MQEGFSIQLREDQPTELLSLQTLAYAINTEAAEVNRRAEIIGNYLIQAKEQLPDDSSFMSWVSENCPFSHSTALGLMKYARGLSETPSLIGKPKSIVLEVMKLPAAEREEFVAENDGKSVRQIRKLIEERDAAIQQEELAKKAYQEAAKKSEQLVSSYEKVNDLYYEEKAEKEALQRRLEEAVQAEPKIITETVEVAPPDYEQLKEQSAEALAAAQRAEEEAASLRRMVKETEEYAEEQEELRKKAQSELRRVQESTHESVNTNGHFSAESLGTTFHSFLTSVGTLPHMAAFFRSMPHEELQVIDKWLKATSEWLEGASKAVQEGFLYIGSDDSSNVV